MNLVCAHWDDAQYAAFTAYLKTLADPAYRQFHAGLVPGLEGFFGVRMPALRAVCKQIAKGDGRSFLACCQNDLYEQTMCEGIVTGLIKADFDEFCTLTDRFVAKIDNWAICDCFCSGLKQIKRYKEAYFAHIVQYLAGDNPWANRAGLVIMLSYYVEEPFLPAVLTRCDRLRSEAYYVRMAQAWLVSVCYAKFPDLTYLESDHLDDWTHNKAIQKIRESNRISADLKQKLTAWKR